MANDFDILASSLNNYVVTPLNAFGLGGFLFDIEDETNVTLTADITDHFLEDNSTVQDHIALKPKKITLKGFVGELVHENDDSETSTVEKVTQKLTVLNSYLPILSDGSGQIADILRDDNNTEFTLEGVNKTADYWAFVKNILAPDNKQQQAYLYFKALFEGRFLLSVQTPFEFMSRMVIESIVAKQDGGSKYISDFTITLKQIRSVDVLNVEGDSTVYTDKEEFNDKLQTRSDPQNQEVVQVGNVDGTPTSFGNVNDPQYQAAQAAQAARRAELEGVTWGS